MYSVLVADDEPLALKSICSVISRRSKDFEVTATAENGLEALQKIRENAPDLVICDIKMPMLTGVELAEILREEFPDVCCIIVSGYQDFAYTQSAIRSGVIDYLLKPLVPAALLQSLDYAKTRIRKIQYTKQKSILRALSNGEEVSEKVIRRYMPSEKYYAALIRTNGLPKRFSIEKSREIYSDIHEQYVIFGRDEMESLCLIPEELLTEEDFTHFLEKLQEKQQKDDYYTLIFDRRVFSPADLQEKIKTLYQELDQKCSVGRTQIFDLAKGIDAGKISITELQKKEESLLFSLETICRNGKLEEIQKEIRWGYESLCEYQISQLWLENFTRKVLSVMRQNGLCKLSTTESEYLLNDSFFYATSIKMLTDSLLDVFLQPEKEATFGGKVDSQEYFAMIEKYLNSNLNKPLTLQGLCHHFGISQAYMSKVFRKYSSNSFSQYLTELRMKRAKELLTEKPNSYIKDVAAMVGYEDQFYFSRIFRSYTGKSPSEFVKEIR